MKNTYKITVTDTATYYIKAENEGDAIDRAIDWFGEREPDIDVEVTTEEEDYEIK